MLMPLFKLESNPIMNMMESSVLPDVCEKTLGCSCIILMAFIVHKDAALFSAGEALERFFVSLAAAVLLLNFIGWGLYFSGRQSVFVIMFLLSRFRRCTISLSGCGGKHRTDRPWVCISTCAFYPRSAQFDLRRLFMKKWLDEEYEFEVEVTGFLRGEHTENYCRNGEELGDKYTCTYGCPVNSQGQGICPKVMLVLFPIMEAVRSGGDLENVGGDGKYSKTIVCPDGCVMFRLSAKRLGNANPFKSRLFD